MDVFQVEGGRRLEGRLCINGSKNAALPLLAASLLSDQPLTLRDVPDLADIRNMLRLLSELGRVRVNDDEPFSTITLGAGDEASSHARYEVVKTMRASICVLGPLVAKRGFARVAMPGGCAIGDRPVDLHIRGLRALGAMISLEAGDIVAKAPPGGLRGDTVFLGGRFGSTVLGTANIMSAATLARGVTIIESAACEPEIVDLANLLNAMGAKISGQGSPRIRVEGVEELGGADHRVIPDRIEAGTFLAAAAITNGDLTLENCPLDALLAVKESMEEAGVHLRRLNPSEDPMRATVRVTADRVLRPLELTTQPHPGFPTDLQAQFMALLSLADGNSVITERIFPERFLHVAELSRMGANLFRQGSTVVISGVRKLIGAPVMASDLRASACLVLAGLAANGVTEIHRVYHLDRGYERMEERLASVGAAIERRVERVLAE